MAFKKKEEKNELDSLIKDLEKEFGAGVIFKPNSSMVVDVKTISTGSFSLDQATGVGGLPRGRIVEIFGPESGGKTTLCLSVVAQAQKIGDLCAYIDVENALDLQYAKKLGVDIDKLMVSQPNGAEEALNLVHRLISSKKVGVIVVDSVAALVPRTEDEGNIGDQTIGLQARMMSQAMRKLVSAINKTNTLVIFINQIRMKIGGGPAWGNPETTSGGKALPFAASMRIDIRRISTLKEDDLPVGIEVKAKIAKNKVAPPFRVAQFYIIFGEGISLEADIFNVAVKEGIIDKKGKTYYYNDDKIGIGVRDSLKTLKVNKDLLNLIQGKLEQYETKKAEENKEEDKNEENN